MLQDNAVRMGALITLGLLSLFLLAKTLAEFESLQFMGSMPGARSQISVQGKGEVAAMPSIGLFTFTVSEESLVVKEAQDEAAQKSNAILKYLTENGVAAKDITTNGYNVYPRYEYGAASVERQVYPPYPIPVPDGKQRLAAYVVSQSVTVKVRNLDTAGKLLAGVGEIGASNISGLSFDYDDRDALVKEARDKAIKEARGEATALAKALGVRLVRIVSYNENGGYPVPMLMYAKAETSGRGGGVTPEIPVGEEKITSNVSITYEIK